MKPIVCDTNWELQQRTTQLARQLSRYQNRLPGHWLRDDHPEEFTLLQAYRAQSSQWTNALSPQRLGHTYNVLSQLSQRLALPEVVNE